MIFHSFRHLGSRAFAKKEIAVDFDALPALLAVFGSNWAGKTTFLDLLCALFWLVMPYRPTALIHQFVAKGFIEGVWSAHEGGVKYKSVVRVDPVAKRTEADLSIVGGRHIAGPLMGDYLKAVEEIVGPLETALASMYAVQRGGSQRGTGAFLGLPRRDRYEVFADFMQLQAFVARFDRAKAKVKVLESELERSRGAIAALGTQAAKKDAVVAASLEVGGRLNTALSLLQTRLADHRWAGEILTAARGLVASLEPVGDQVKTLTGEVAAEQAAVDVLITRRTDNEVLLARAAEIRAAVAREAVLRASEMALTLLEPESAGLTLELVGLNKRRLDSETRCRETEQILAAGEDIREAVARSRELAANITALDPEIAAARTRHQAATEAFHAGELKRERLASRRREMATLRAEDTEIQRVLARTDEIGQAVRRTAAIAAEITALAEDASDLQAAFVEAQAGFQRGQTLRERLAVRTGDQTRVQADVTTLSTVPCRGEGPYATCAFLTRAQQASRQLPAVQADIDALTQEAAALPQAAPTDLTTPLRKRILELEEERRGLATVAAMEPQLTRLRERADVLRVSLRGATEDEGYLAVDVASLADGPPTDPTAPLTALRGTYSTEQQGLVPLVSMSDELAAATARVEELRASIAELTASIAAKTTRHAEITAALATWPGIKNELARLAEVTCLAAQLELAGERARSLQEQIDGIQPSLSTKRARLTGLAAEYARLPGARAEVAAAEIVLATAGADAEAQRGVVSVLEREQAAANTILSGVEQAERELAALQQQAQPLLDDLEDWTLIARACSPRGISALLIDQALPEVGQLATDLLRECFGGELFSMALTTQRETQDDRLVEAFDVLVTRNNEQVPVEMLCGGELALASEGLALAIALYNSTRFGRRYSTLLRDEVTAALTPENAKAYVRLLRRAIEIGGFRQILFISHHVQSQDLADAKLLVRDGLTGDGIITVV